MLDNLFVVFLCLETPPAAWWAEDCSKVSAASKEMIFCVQ